ncbi:MAG: hypothetical protein HQM06_09820 [Magnetococcales bacterium]|nr:hypothetical protein [Magnetococcales bacterium]
MNTILWVAWGSSVIIPIKIWLLLRYVRRKMAEDQAVAEMNAAQGPATHLPAQHEPTTGADHNSHATLLAEKA